MISNIISNHVIKFQSQQSFSDYTDNQIRRLLRRQFCRNYSKEGKTAKKMMTILSSGFLLPNTGEDESFKSILSKLHAQHRCYSGDKTGKLLGKLH